MVKNSKEPKKRGLGRGLEALFDESPQVQETEEITEISLDEIRPNPYQPRKVFNEGSALICRSTIITGIPASLAS